MTIEATFLTNVIKRCKEYKALGEKTFDQLNDEEFFFSPDKDSNSIAVIVKHLHGNMLSRWTNFLTEDGEKPWRRRDEEFEVSPGTKETVLQGWGEGWAVFLNTLASLTEDDLMKTVTIRSQPLSVTDAICRQLAHYSYHTGQIVYLGKWLKGSGWKTLSIAKGDSQNYNRQLEQK